MSKTRRVFQIPWYPVLVCAMPVVSLFVINRAELSALDLLRPFLIAVLAGAGIFAVSYLFTRRARTAALASLVPILGIALYEQIQLMALSFTGLADRHQSFLTAWTVSGLLVFSAVCVALRRSQRSFADLTIVLNVFACSVLALAVLPGVMDLIRPHSRASNSNPESMTAAAWRQSMEADWSSIERPDIYFIILDAYARQDILETRFDFDNRPFLDWLSSSGFFVARHSHANYPITHYSLASTLNAEYLHQLLSPDLLVNAPDTARATYQYIVSEIADRHIRRSRVHELLASAGYQYRSNDSGYRVTRRIPESVWDALSRSVTEFERELLELTALYPLLERSEGTVGAAMTMHESVLRDLRQLASIEPSTVPGFYFYHFLSPHFPFSFNEDGSKRLRHPVYARSAWIQDRRDLTGYLDYYRDNYPRNVAGLNRHLKSAIQSILDKTDRKAVIIIQSDHGPSLGYVPSSASESDIPERFGIFNAIFLPDGVLRDGLRDDFSAINTFPIVFESLFGLRFPDLEDRAFMPTGPLEFEDVTGSLTEQRSTTRVGSPVE